MKSNGEGRFNPVARKETEDIIRSSMGEYSVQEARVVTTIPSLNEERSIERSVRSLMAQDLPASWHVIHVVDGGSTDKTIDIVKELQDEVERNGGPTIQVIRNRERFSPQASNLSLEAYFHKPIEQIFC